MTIQAVLFDLDDTLLNDDRSVYEAVMETCKLAADAAGIDAHELEKAIQREAREVYATYDTIEFTRMIGINAFEGLWGHFTRGGHPMFRRMQQIAPEYRLAAWTRALAAFGVDNPQLAAAMAEMFPAKRRELKYVFDETFAALDRLRGKYKLLLLTNGSPDLQQEKLDGVPELIPYFDHIVISGDFGEGKPSPRLFHYAMDKLGISAREGIMVGDKLTTDIIGANGVGMPSVWINRRGLERSADIVPAHEIASLLELPAIIEQY